MALLGTPASSSCRWVPSPGSNSRPCPSQRSRYPLWLRRREGAWLAVPSTTSSRTDIDPPYDPSLGFDAHTVPERHVVFDLAGQRAGRGVIPRRVGVGAAVNDDRVV